jgi:hypothetical protein
MKESVQLRLDETEERARIAAFDIEENAHR